MAKSAAVWGIDIGRCALKALRCHLDGESVVADGFDYIEYPKLLTQPEADAPQLIKEALEQFLSRNSVKGDKVAVAEMLNPVAKVVGRHRARTFRDKVKPPVPKRPVINPLVSDAAEAKVRLR